MIKPDFSKYSLALIDDSKNEIIFSINKEGLRPIIECVKKIKDQKSSKIFKAQKSGFILFDKVIGLAAARIIIHAGNIKEVYTDVCSIPALDILEKNNISVNYEILVENILRKDKHGTCPMELKAETYTNNETFYNDILTIFYPK